MMKCKDIHALLPEYIEGSLAPEDSALVASHMEMCAHCQTAAGSLRTVLERKPSQEPPGSPTEAYWNGLLPRIHERIQSRKVQPLPFLRPAWSLKVALPLALAVVLGVVFLRSVRVSAPGADQGAATELQQVPREELEAYVERQSVVGAEEPLPAQTRTALTRADREVVKNILEETPEVRSVVESYQTELLANVTDQEDAAIVSILEKQK